MTTTTTDTLPIHGRTPITIADAQFAAIAKLASIIGVTVEQLIDYSIGTHAREDLSRNEVLSAGLKYCRGKRCRCRKLT